MQVVNPATGEVIAEAPLMKGAETRAAIAAAETAFPTWSRQVAKERCKVMRRRAASTLHASRCLALRFARAGTSSRVQERCYSMAQRWAPPRGLVDAPVVNKWPCGDARASASLDLGSKGAVTRGAPLLRRWYDEVVAHQDDICTIMTMESGKPFSESRSEFQSGWGPPRARSAAFRNLTAHACFAPNIQASDAGSA